MTVTVTVNSSQSSNHYETLTMWQYVLCHFKNT